MDKGGAAQEIIASLGLRAKNCEPKEVLRCLYKGGAQIVDFPRLDGRKSPDEFRKHQDSQRNAE